MSQCLSSTVKLKHFSQLVINYGNFLSYFTIGTKVIGYGSFSVRSF